MGRHRDQGEGKGTHARVGARRAGHGRPCLDEVRVGAVGVDLCGAASVESSSERATVD